MRTTRAVVTLLACLAIGIMPVAASDPELSGGKGGDRDHLDPVVEPGPPSRLVLDNFELLGHTNLGGGVPNGDVYLYDHPAAGKHAYVGTWSAQCTGQGVKVVNVSDPSRPRWLGYVGARKGSSLEDVVVTRIGDRDVLGIGVQQCGRGGANGLALYDVTDPATPSELAFLPTVAGVHELDLASRNDGRAIALLALPFAEFTFDPETGEPTPRGEFQIADITDPSSPEIVTEWRLYDQGLTLHEDSHEVTSPFQGNGLFPVMFAHSVRAADDGTTAYVSYWDAGVVKVDISDLDNPETIGHTVFNAQADGDAHSMTPYEAGGTRYILQNDEDFDTGHTTATVTSSVTGSTEFAGIQEYWAPTRLADVGPMTATVFDAGDGCDEADYAGSAGMIALADTVDPFYAAPPCPIGAQLLLAADAGAVAFVSNLLSIDDAWAFGPDLDASLADAAGVPAVQISDIDGLAAAIRGSTETVTMTLTPNVPAWGYLRVFAEGTDESWEQVGEYTGPAANGTDSFPAGSWSIHNTEVRGDRAYSAWYSAGILAIDMSDPTNPHLVGQFVPPSSRRHANSLGTGPAEVWGVAVDPETGIIYASDMRTGLWIVRPIGEAASD